MGRLIKNEIYDYNRRKESLASLQTIYPEAKIGSIGKSVLGREIPYIKIGNGKKQVLYVGGFHGSEHITSVILLKFAEDLCLSLAGGLPLEDINLKKGLMGRSLVIIPCINPDGCEIAINGPKSAMHFSSLVTKLSRGDYIHWNANARGVDINHNFDADWETVHRLERQAGIFGPSPSKYGGTKPFSEPESSALAVYCTKNSVNYVLAFHSQGEVIYWNFGGKAPAYSQKMAAVMAATSGYALDVPIGTAVGGGFKDWFIDKFCRPGFTIELGLGKNPLPPEHADKIYIKAKETLTVSAIM